MADQCAKSAPIQNGQKFAKFQCLRAEADTEPLESFEITLAFKKIEKRNPSRNPAKRKTEKKSIPKECLLKVVVEDQEVVDDRQVKKDFKKTYVGVAEN